MSTLVRIGLCELAFGAMLGWLVAASRANPDSLRRIGITSPNRVLQCHLDYLMMGLILIAVGSVAHDLPVGVQVALVFGTIVNPGLFMVMAFNEKVMRSKAMLALTVVSFIAMSGSLVATAIVA
jgi:hypothetical protein